MKQTYKKPIARLEYFALSQSIADYCGAGNGDFGKPGNHADKDCGWIIDDEIFWVNGTACTVPTDPDGDISGVCYHNPEGGGTIFGS